MVFASSFFIFAFLPGTLILYWIADKFSNIIWRNAVLLVASAIFYAWGGIKWLLLLIVLIIINYVITMLIDKYVKYKKILLILAILLDLMNLCYFKYFNFLIENMEKLGGIFFKKEISIDIPAIVLPIGISFFTFQILSYVIDVYKGEVPVQRNVFKLALYVMMFPQLIAGPIVRYKDINEEIESRTITSVEVEEGIKRFIIGFAKKVFLANTMGSMADIAFSQWQNINFIYAWLGAICYTLQIYYDFSAYSDMAIGLGGMFGFHFNENFNYPYISRSIKEFWRRWHISLSTWFRDYVYIPLGGNRKGSVKTYRNLALVFLLTGIWHGAAWQFIFWGLYHGFFLLIERIGWGKVLNKIPKIFQHIYTMFVVIIGWVFFRSDNLHQAFIYIKNMFSFNFNEIANIGIVTNISGFFVIMFTISLLFSMPIYLTVKEKLIDKYKNCGRIIMWIIGSVSILYMIGLAYNPFIYFKF